MKKFVVVCGPGRSGTSLACELVKACGFNFGKCNPLQEFGLRSGYNENPLTNCQGAAIGPAIDKLEEQGANAVKLIHLYAQWIPRLKTRGYDVRIVVTSRSVEEGIQSGNKLYTGWKPQAIPAICGFLTISRGSIFESVALMQQVFDQDQIDTGLYQELYDKDEQASKMLLGMFRSYDK